MDDITQPNILLIMPDQMRGDCLSLAHHPVLLTPNIDAIAGQGAFFTHAYTTHHKRLMHSGAPLPADRPVPGYQRNGRLSRR
ncbi:MAG: sulfatase-like hydrolase/transferase [Anaerolineae bacterium]|nr:sulfatase-like hydrolase/transferase [Anaerolineae bacterium]